jgi:hypothetical protein
MRPIQTDSATEDPVAGATYFTPVFMPFLLQKI